MERDQLHRSLGAHALERGNGGAGQGAGRLPPCRGRQPRRDGERRGRTGEPAEIATVAFQLVRALVEEAPSGRHGLVAGQYVGHLVAGGMDVDIEGTARGSVLQRQRLHRLHLLDGEARRIGLGQLVREDPAQDGQGPTRGRPHARLRVGHRDGEQQVSVDRSTLGGTPAERHP